jgi:hypothetical protein
MAEPLSQITNVTDYSKSSNPKAQATTTSTTPATATTPATSATPNQTAQPGAAQQPVARKSKKWIWWTIGGIGLFVIVALGIWYFFY